MKSNLLIIAFSFFALLLYGQNEKTYIAISEITLDEAKSFYNDNDFKWNFDDNRMEYFPSDIDLDSIWREKDKGNYLVFKPKEEDIEIELNSILPFSIHLYKEKNTKYLSVLNLENESVENAVVEVEEKQIAFNKKNNAYTWKKPKYGSDFSVELNGVIGYFDGDYSYDKRNKKISHVWRKIKSNRVGYMFITAPKIWCAEQIDKLRERWVYGGKREKGYHSDVYNNEKIYWGRKRKSTNGYIAQNKPKYLPEDTVKVKAYLTNHKGKPLSKEIDFFIKDYMNDTIIQEKIKPVSSGNYQYEFVLGDSLEIDRNYEFIFKPKNKFAKEKSFRLEDYELGDVEFDFTVSKSNYEKDEEVKFSANAKYTNGRRAAARIRISLTTTFVEEYLLDTMFVKEILWTYEENLDFEDETEIIIPDSILPQADMRMKATAELFTADGELEVFERSFRINSEASLAAEGKLVMESENGFLKADYIINNKSVSKDAVLSRISNFNTNIQKIKLPYSEKINPFYSSFEIETDNDWDELDEYELGEAKINSFGKRGLDSLQFNIQNPYGILIEYAIYKDNKKIEEGISKDIDFIWKRKNNNLSNYTLAYQYVWGGEMKAENKSLPIHKNELKIEVNQAQEIEPGAEIEVAIQVKDAKGRPAKNVDLTAAAISKKFEDYSESFMTPYIAASKNKYPRGKGKNIYFKVDEIDKRKRISDDTYNKFNLDSSLDYRMRFPENGIRKEYIKLDDELKESAQFIPLIVEKGEYQYPYSIHLDRNSIYYHDAPQSYVFVASAGMHKIDVRLYDALITLDSVELRKGYKLIISVDKDLISKVENAKYQVKDEYWDTYELRNRKLTIIQLRNSTYEDTYLYQKGRKIYKISRYNSKYIGPFHPKDSLVYLEQYHLQKTTEFEGSFAYYFKPDNDRLYEFQLDDTEKKVKLTYEKFDPNFNVTALTKVEFLPEKEKKTDVFHDLYENNTAMKEIGRGSFNLGYDGENPVLFTIIDRRNKKQIYRKDVRNFYNLFPGEYELYMLFPKGYYSLDFEVRANTKSYIRLPEELTLKSDKYEQTIWDIFGKDYLWDEDIFNISHDKILGEYNIIIDKENNVMKPILKGELVKVNGLITDEMGDPIVFANVMVRYYEDDYVAITDYDGFYEISIPNDAKELLVTYIGYEDQIIDLSKDNYGMHNMTMTEGVLLDAVVVTALGISRDEKSMGYAAVSLSSLESRSTGVALSGKVSGIQITNSSGRLGDNIDLKIRGASSVSAGNEPLYIINGVPISAEKAKELDADLIQGINVLKEDAAVAIYGAVAKNGAIIITLKEGTNTDFLQEELSGFQMRENFSDYAYWQPNLKTDKNGMAIFTAKLPDDITGWNTYVLGMDNKKRGGVSVVDFMAYKKLMAELSVPRFAVEGDSINIIGQANNYTQDSLDISTTFKLEDKVIYNDNSTIVNNKVDEKYILVPNYPDTLNISYELKTGNYGDGEKREIPVYKKGTTESVGEFHVLRKEKTASYDSQLGEDVLVNIRASRLDVIFEDLKYLQNYSYGCAEQTSSKLIALLLKKEIQGKQGKIFLGEGEIIANIQRLDKMQNSDNSWGWWSDNPRVDWITLYVAEALQMAVDAGYESASYASVMQFLATNMASSKPAHQFKAMDLLLNEGTNIDTSFINKHEEWDLTLNEFLLISKLKQRSGIEVNWLKIDSLITETTYGGIFINSSKYKFNSKKKRYYWYYRNQINQLLAYDIFALANKQKEKEAFELYLMMERPYNGYQNTIRNAQTVLRLLPSILEDDGTVAENPSILVNGKQINKFPYTQKMKGKIQVEKNEKTPYFVSFSEEKYIPNPKKVSNVFVVDSYFEQRDKKVEYLEIATATELFVKINAKKKADYVMVEIPIPAGCSYDESKKGRKYGESHREYFKDRVVVFFNSLAEGNRTIKIDLKPRYKGKYTLNPAKVEEMYAPIIFGRESMKRVDLK